MLNDYVYLYIKKERLEKKNNQVFLFIQRNHYQCLKSFLIKKKSLIDIFFFITFISEKKSTDRTKRHKTYIKQSKKKICVYVSYIVQNKKEKKKKFLFLLRTILVLDHKEKRKKK
jgi:hypothetical protein